MLFIELGRIFPMEADMMKDILLVEAEKMDRARRYGSAASRLTGSPSAAAHPGSALRRGAWVGRLLGGFCRRLSTALEGLAERLDGAAPEAQPQAAFGSGRGVNHG